MTQTSIKPQDEIVESPLLDEGPAGQVHETAARDRFVDQLRLLWGQRRFLLRATSAGLLAAAILAFLIPRRYESTTRLMPPDNKSTSGLAMLSALSGRTGGLMPVAGDLLGLKTSSAIFIGILRSRTVEDRLIVQFDLKRVYWDRRMEDAREDLERRSKISEDRKNGIITITVTDKDPRRAAALAQAYVQELDRLVAELTTSAAHRERVFLEQRLKAVKTDLDAAAREFSQFASKNTAIDIKEQGRAMVEAAATLQGHLIAAQSELEGLRQIYTDNNVRVRAVRARIAELQHQLEKLGGKELNPADPARAGGEPLYPSIRKLPLLGVTYADLFRRTKIQETVFELLTQQYELAKVEEAKEIPSVKVLDVADVPEKKSFPPRLLIISLGTLLSFAFGVAWVFGSATWEQTDPNDPRRKLAEEVFQTVNANLPWISRNGSAMRTMRQRIVNRLRRQPGSEARKP
ncbi:MAG: lipopolysaccharide biosynthesis protein [Acidobacteria bacterium]|nr:lipopolysaccharide biosynthesis protein [Acidobacteriota bacterium]